MFTSGICVYYVVIVFSVFQMSHLFNMDTEHARIYRGRSNGSMFGFAVEFIKSDSGGYQLYIGAPKQDTEVNQTGVVYICDVTQDRCSPYYERSRNTGRARRLYNRSSYYKEMFGSTITQLNNTAEVCAYRWTDIDYERERYWFLPGRCHSVTKKDSFIEELPLKMKNEYIDGPRQEFKYGMGQAGFSADANKDGFFVIGAPGIAEWRGGFVVFKDIAVSIFDKQYKLPLFSYLGYSVVVGNFCPGKDRTCFAAGAPLFEREGMVFFYEYELDKYEQYKSSLIYTIRPNQDTGRQSFSFFGGSLCAADVNGDGMDDVLISVPFYCDLDGSTSSIDEGRVYVYNNVAKQPQTGDDVKYFSDRPTILSGSKISDARFGTSMANAGDLNSDGFEDVAIGAPYEDDGRGVVYLYHGSASGVVAQYSQKILGRSFSDSVFTFGWYISKSVDLDGNSYPDIAVGNYLSDTAVVLRTRPIADIHGNISMTPSLIIRNNSCPNSIPEATEGCFIIHICFSYTGRHLPKTLDVEYNMTLDAEKSGERKRVMANTTTGISYSVSNRIRVNEVTGSCHSYHAFTLQAQRDRDIFPLVHVVADFILAQPADMTSDVQPIMNNTRNKRIEKDIAFQIECGDDGQCNADLNLRLSVRMSHAEDYVIINKTKNIYLQFELSNKGEDAFANVISLTWTGTLQYQTVDSEPLFPVQCTSVLDADATNVYKCEVTKPVRRGHDVGFVVTLDAHDISTTLPSILLHAVAHTSSNETNVEDDHVTTEIEVRIVTNIKITSAIQDDIRLVESQLESRHLKLLHRYVIRNMGPSFLPRTSIIVDVPTFSKSGGSTLVTSTMVKIRFEDGREEFCSAVLSEREIAQSKNSTTTTLTPSTTTRGGLPARKPQRRKRETKNSQIDVRNSLDITCDEFLCRRFRCKISNMNPGENIELNATIELPAKNMPTGEELLIRYFTRLQVKQPKHKLFLAWKNPAVRKVWTNIFIQRSGGSVNIWIIIGSVIGGLLLLIILLVVLWLLGFFKRAKKQKVEQKKRESGYYQRGRSNTRGSSQRSVRSTAATCGTSSDTKTSISEENEKLN